MQSADKLIEEKNGIRIYRPIEEDRPFDNNNNNVEIDGGAPDDG